MPELAHRELRPDEDMPFTTLSDGSVMAGTMTPPGHMQNE